MPKVQRVKIVLGEFHVIEYAVRADGSQPARDFLADLHNKRLEGDPDEPNLPADAQLADYHKFIEACRQLAKHGEPKYRGQVNALDEGVWEFKAGAKRVTWYDTDGYGEYVEKHMHHDRATAPNATLDFWWFPDFDFIIRLGHSFLKRSQRTSAEDISASLITRMEDLDYDRP